jgi:hypothetical protein
MLLPAKAYGRSGRTTACDFNTQVSQCPLSRAVRDPGLRVERCAVITNSPGARESLVFRRAVFMASLPSGSGPCEGHTDPVGQQDNGKARAKEPWVGRLSWPPCGVMCLLAFFLCASPVLPDGFEPSIACSLVPGGSSEPRGQAGSLCVAALVAVGFSSLPTGANFLLIGTDLQGPWRTIGCFNHNESLKPREQGNWIVCSGDRARTFDLGYRRSSIELCL